MFTPFKFTIDLNGKSYPALIKPQSGFLGREIPSSFQFFVNNIYWGTITHTGRSWVSDSAKSSLVADKIGEHITEYYGGSLVTE
jgi:hypothetical protein